MQPSHALPALREEAAARPATSVATLVLLTALLAACATPVILLRNETTGEMAHCGGNRIGSMEGRSTEQASDEACVRDYEAKGFRRTSEAEEKLRQQRATPARAPAKPTMPVESRWLLAAENLARANGCRSPLATLTGKGAGEERFEVSCAGGAPFAPVACNYDGCRLIAR